MKRLVLILLLLVSLPTFSSDAKYDSNRFHNAVVRYQEAILVEELSRLDLTDRNEVEFMFEKALESHNLFFYQQILTSGYDVNATFEYNNTLLHEAVKVRDIDIINTLLNHGAYVNAVNDKGHTPLHLAAVRGYEEISRLLVSKGAKGNPPYATDDDLLLGQIPIESATNGRSPYAKEQVNTPAQYTSERLQFVWKAPLQGRQTLWSIKTDGTDLRQVLDERQLYARELGDRDRQHESELERAFRSPDNRYLLLYYSGRGEVVFYDLKTNDYVPITETRARFSLAPQWNTDSTVLVGINLYEYRALSYDKRNTEKAIRRDRHHLYTFKDKTILNSDNDGISVVNAAGDSVRHVDISENCCKELTDRAISADEKYLLFIRSKKLTIVNLQTMSVQMAEESKNYYSDPVFDDNNRFAYVIGNKHINKIDIQTKAMSSVFFADKKEAGSFEHLTKLSSGHHKDVITLVDRTFPDLAEHYDEDGNYYFGTLSDGKYQGYGEWFNRYYIILDKDRNRYVVSYKGEWLNGGYHGAGDLLMSDGSHYQGQWVLGEKHGSGTLVSADGERYDGQWRDNKRHGRGTCSAKGESGDCFYFDGEVLTYSGETDQQGLRHGHGQASWGEGYSLNTYIGQWENDKISGFGELDGYASGEFTYKGEFKNDLFDGQGTYAANNRGYYKGQWKAGKKQGQGVYRSNAESATREVAYEGQWKDDQPTGTGIYTYTSMDKKNSRTYDRYEFTDNTELSTLYSISGNGKHTAFNGDIYIGDFQDNGFHGQGTLTKANGDIYKGEWAYSQLNGDGYWKSAEGFEYTGIWRGHKKHGTGVCIAPDKKQSACRYYYGYKAHHETPVFSKIKSVHGFETPPVRGEYIGETRNNKPHGEGTITRKGDYTYIGHFADGLKSGKGRLINYKGHTKYKGNYKNDFYHGYGETESYKGHWKQGEFHGQGKLTVMVAVMGVGMIPVHYEGIWVDGKTAKGEISYADDSNYQGSWDADRKKQGKGVLITREGHRIAGSWENDQLVGKYTTFKTNGDKIIQYSDEKKLSEYHFARKNRPKGIRKYTGEIYGYNPHRTGTCLLNKRTVKCEFHIGKLEAIIK